jgi:transposase
MTVGRALAEMLRLGIVPTCYIYQEAQRELRDLLRQRSFVVRQKTSQLLHTGNILSRNQGRQQLHEVTVAGVRQLFPSSERPLAVTTTRSTNEPLQKLLRCSQGEVFLID